MSAHTPGPWHVDAEDYAPCIVAENGTHVVCFGHDYDDYGGIGTTYPNPYPAYGTPEYTAAALGFEAERQANALLLAAAPDLLAALKELLEEGRGSTYGMCKENVRLAEATIAKAEGRDV